ncbi:MAG: class I SAM-dependent methyltransferase [Candidatus Aminicenantales bacterium]
MGIINQPPAYYFEAYFSRRYLAHLIHKKRIDKIVSLIPEKSFVLDAGCGSGIVPFLLASKKNCTGVGIDIRKECVEFASRHVPAFEFYNYDVRNFSLPHRFDVIVCMEVLEHFDSTDQAKTIGCLDNHLKDGGLLILTFPSKFYFFIEPLWKQVRKLLHPSTVFDDEEHHHAILRGKFVDVLRQMGYTVEKSGLHALGWINYIVARRILRFSNIA